MRDVLLAAAAAGGGLLTRKRALEIVPRHVFDDAVSSAVLERIHPGVYVRADVPRDRTLRRRAALAYLPSAVLSHVDALDIWRLPVPAAVLGDSPVHLTSGPRSVPRDRSVCLHRRRDYQRISRFAIGRHQLRVLEPAQAIVESWPLLPEGDRRAPAIVALRDRRVSLPELIASIDRDRCTPGAAEMREMFSLVDGGCHSELELWGHAHVFADPRLRRARAQWPVPVGGRVFRLDRYFEEEMVDVEMDGAAYHGLPGQRERDIERDAALAALGILVLRYSHQRLHREPDRVVAELIRVLDIRGLQLRGA